MADAMVQMAQQWMNKTYGDDSRYNRVTANGNTGWATINGLIRALQIELGIQSTADNFGDGTKSAFNVKYPNGIPIQAESDTTEKKVYGIIQCALWCKGYPAVYGCITENYHSDVAAGVKVMQQDAGASNANGTVSLNTMIALLSMNQYIIVSGGTGRVRSIQQGINQKYEAYVGLSPCDGLYGREMNKALIKVLQAVEGLSPSEATGAFGSTTKSKCPEIPGSGLSNESEAIYLFRWALCCNGYEVEIASGSWDSVLTSIVNEFQEDMALTKTGKGDLNSWMSLLLSSGNTDRSTTACDTRFEITEAYANWLNNMGYKTVGRYVSGGSFKELRSAEPKTIIDKGLGFFPIFQESATNLTYFTESRGIQDAMVATINATKLGIPNGTVIYFAVDTDPQDTDISDYIIPYFRGLWYGMQEVIINTNLEIYKIGIYGTRNACIQVANAGYTESSFVSDMSTGFSGNMGFKMPANWNYDQYFEIEYTNNWGIDKVAYAEKLPSVNTLTAKYAKPSPNTRLSQQKNIDYLIDVVADLEEYFVQYFQTSLSPNNQPSTEETVRGVTRYLRHKKYDSVQWFITEGAFADSGFVDYVGEKGSKWLSDVLDIIASNADEDLVYDGDEGYLDVGHFAATLEAYLSWSVIPNWWAGWGGDLASAGKQLSHKQATRLQESFDIIGSTNGNFNYSDMCCDADAIKLAAMIKQKSGNHALSEAMREYYKSSLVKDRFKYFLDDAGVAYDATFAKIYEGLLGKFGAYEYAAMVNLLGGLSTTKADIEYLLLAFATYIYDKLKY